MHEKIVVNFIVTEPRSYTAAEMTRLVGLGQHFETKELNTKCVTDVRWISREISTFLYVMYSCVLNLHVTEGTVLVAKRSHRYLVLNASQAAISSK
jgi:uncharacterized protein with PQ loop repeat